MVIGIPQIQGTFSLCVFFCAHAGNEDPTEEALALGIFSTAFSG